MDFRNEALAELARDAALERSDFLVRAGEQLERFIGANRERIRALGGLVLLETDDDYLAVAPDGTFRSRSRVFDEATGSWVSETEVIESAAELVELYNPADVYAAFAEAAEEADASEDEEEDAGEIAGEAVDESAERPGGLNGEDPYAGAADRWAAGHPADEAEAGEDPVRDLYDLALDYQEKSQQLEAGLLEEFGSEAAGLSALVGEIVITEDDDERLVLDAGARFRAAVLAEETGRWEELRDAASIVEYYDPTDVFSDLADAIAEAHPDVAPPIDGSGGEGGQARAGTEDGAGA